MKIESASPSARPLARRAVRAQGGRDFASHLDHATAATPASGGPLGIDAVTSLFVALEVTPEMGAQRRGTSILDRLDEIRHGLLAGALTRRSLEDLAGLVAAERARITDPRLAGVLDEIDLRARVELAKYAP